MTPIRTRTRTEAMSAPLSVSVLLSLYVCLSGGVPVVDMQNTVSVSGEDSVLRCPAELRPGVAYRTVRWYKVVDPSSESPRRSGLLYKELPNGSTVPYSGLGPGVTLLDQSHSLLLPNVSCGDQGVYLCFLAAPVGQQNREGQVLLTLTDCPNDQEQEVITDTFLVISACFVMMVALFIFTISYVSLSNMIKSRNTAPKKEVLLDAPLKPLEKKDLKLIYTLGPKPPTLKHVYI